MFKNDKKDEIFNGSDLYVAQIEYLTFDEEHNQHYHKITNLKFMYERINEKGVIKYRDVLSKIVLSDSPAEVNGYLVNIEPLTDYYPDLANTKIPKIALYIIIMDELNDSVMKLKKKNGV